jgi:2,3-diaminopropionate biosynthesis protein SbnA
LREHESVVSCIGRTPLVQLSRLFTDPALQVVAKLELLNPTGSSKDRPARLIIEQGLREGTITPATHLVESTSGNLGIALATIARVYGLRLTCVVDPHTTPTNLTILRQLGATVDMVTQRDHTGGYLHTRIRRVQQLVDALPHALWINQYANERNWQAHYHATAGEILADLDQPIDALVAPVSTTGTILGLARRLRPAFPALRVVAVDAVGSVIFGGSPGPRQLPGLGASRVPELLSPAEIDDVVYVNDREAAHGCHQLVACEGILAGGSSGAAIAAITKLAPTLPVPYRILTVLPDRGDRYLDMVYDPTWCDALPHAADPLTLAGTQ